MRLLIITNLFPNAQEPGRAVFNKQQFMELSKLCELKVVAPIPFFRYSEKQVPAVEMIDGIEVHHPGYLVIPKIFRSLYGLFFFMGVFNTVKNICQSFRFDMILATWAYPDAFGAALVAKLLRKPIYIKVHGSDVNIFSRYLLRGKMMVWAFRRAHKVIAVSEPLKQKIIGMGIPEGKIAVIPNGVDRSTFYPRDKNECRKKLSMPMDKKCVVFVGNLEKVKGVDVLIDAISGVSGEVNLVIVGEGSMKSSLVEKIERLGLTERVLFAGAKAHSEIPLYMNAADVFCLPSRNEGCPNVILEALACGVPVVATNVGAIPEILSTEGFGFMSDPGDSKALAKSIQKALGRNRDQASGKIVIEDWESTARKLFKILCSGKQYC